MGLQSSYVREMARKNKITISKHAFEKIEERGIWLDDVFKAIEQGEQIEIQNFGPRKDIRVVFQEATDDEPSFYVIVATSYPTVDIVSVCRFKEECWEYLGKTKKRRK